MGLAAPQASRSDRLTLLKQIEIFYPAVDNYILSIRHKIEDNPSRPKFILTVHTSGYKFNC
jgi:DNA-binding response OmpR family regulator